MNSGDFKKICRICLDENVVLDWNATLYGYCDMTYKDCFYKYTRLECIASDPFSHMLCQSCLNSLNNLHTFILKALESQKYFQETLYPSNMTDHSTNFKGDVKYTPTEFETVLVEKIEVEPIIQNHYIYEQSDEEISIKPLNTKIEKVSTQMRTKTAEKQSKWKVKTGKALQMENEIEKCSMESATKTIKSDHNVALSFGKSSRKSQRKTKETKTKCDKNGKKLVSDSEVANNEKTKRINVIKSEVIDNNIKDYAEPVEPKVKKQSKEIKTPRMCSICSKILHNKYAVQRHEKTHMENRERKETCKICGLKFYDKRNLYSHKRIHKKNREKIHKCEFCNKAFYDKSGLNIHRRIHLGQMIPCRLCSKQYFRQIDLNRHMSSHSATTINTDTKKRTRYFVRCKHCDKSILSTSFKSHTAAHLNEPLMKCSICSKEFFRRWSCVRHVKKVHQKSNEEYNDFITLYKKNRISHLFLEQKADIQFTH